MIYFNKGLTRDSISIDWRWNGRGVKLVDTAGIRRMAKRRGDNIDNHNSGNGITNGSKNYYKNGNQNAVIEDVAVQDAMRAMKVADVAVLVLDAGAGILQRQELAIADAVVREGRALVVAANKMDLLLGDYENDNKKGGPKSTYSSEDYANDVRHQIESRFPMLRGTPVVPMSSLEGKGVDELMPVAFNARDRWERVVGTGPLNRWLSEVISDRPPPLMVRSGKGGGGHHSHRPLRVKYVIQTKGRPPTFLLFCNVSALPQTYLRYLIRNFQETFEMYGMEVRMSIKKSADGNPYDSSKSKSSKGRIGIGGAPSRRKRQMKELKSTGKRSKKSEGRSRGTPGRWR